MRGCVVGPERSGPRRVGFCEQTVVALDVFYRKTSDLWSNEQHPTTNIRLPGPAPGTRRFRGTPRRARSEALPPPASRRAAQCSGHLQALHPPAWSRDTRVPSARDEAEPQWPAGSQNAQSRQRRPGRVSRCVGACHHHRTLCLVVSGCEGPTGIAELCSVACRVASCVVQPNCQQI